MDLQEIRPEEKAVLQIQPTRALYSEWILLAEQENLLFEVLDLFMPPALNESGLFQICMDEYRNSNRVRSLHGAFIDVDPGSSDREAAEFSRRRCEESCEAALSLGAQNVVFHSSCLSFVRGLYFDLWVDRCASFYEELAEKYGLRIFIENSADVDPGPIRELMRRIPDQRVGVCLDLGHVNFSRTPLEEWFDALGDRIGYLHLSDNKGLFDEHLPIGRGTVNWQRADAFWKSTDRTMPVTLEVGGMDGVRESLAYLRENRFFGCS